MGWVIQETKVRLAQVRVVGFLKTFEGYSVQMQFSGCYRSLPLKNESNRKITFYLVFKISFAFSVSMSIKSLNKVVFISGTTVLWNDEETILSPLHYG